MKIKNKKISIDNNFKKSELEKIKEDILNNLDCGLKKESTNLVFGRGNPNANILIIGEAPGKNEDEQGLPFVGKAGKDLEKELIKNKIEFNKIYIANILKYRPPKNRNPTKKEIEKHTPYLLKQIKIIEPKIIITLGNFATKFVLNNFETKEMDKIEGISKIHGTKKIIKENKKFKNENKNKNKNNNGELNEEENIIVFPMYHPSAMVYNPKIRKEFEKDFQKLSEIINLKN